MKKSAAKEACGAAHTLWSPDGDVLFVCLCVRLSFAWNAYTKTRFPRTLRHLEVRRAIRSVYWWRGGGVSCRPIGKILLYSN